ncbi:carboxylic acid transporter [Russula ochroleuca]|jgi:SHS family lactate transporter-like MFS transporter|uniref:Carboxylic acid transporter n=1 Tax=Russula ochroleuca TaxID=152965 RepID=A0A9P5MN84_9AGAM|nr:carboxylic acid transporter [Russula ochroleuca]
MTPLFIRNLVPRRQACDANRRPLSEVLRSLTGTQWAQFLTGWLAWTCDAIDFFNVALSVTRLQQQFHKAEAASITTAITLTLLVRSIGAILFGVLSDRFGRKWPLVANLLLCSAVQLGTSFVQTFHQFLAVRTLFGIAMGGVWGLASSTALENLPVEARGLGSGVLQQGYAIGYLISAVLSLYVVPHTRHTWRALFWTTSGISAFAATIRAFIPESEVFLRAKEQEHRLGGTTGKKTKVFIHQVRTMLKTHWGLCVYAVLLMAGFNFLSHGSQDLYPTYLKTSKGFDNYHSIVATIIGNCGAITGGAIAGSISQYIGRRLTIILFVLLSGVFIPLWILPSSFGLLAAGAFCVQFGVQGAWGVIPIQLAEMSPPGFRATFPGVAYQLGNMISAASAQIEAIGGDNMKTTIIQDGKLKVVPDYAKVQGILLGTIAAFVIFITTIGPENHGSNFEQQKTAFEEGDRRQSHSTEDEERLPDTRSEKSNEKS